MGRVRPFFEDDITQVAELYAKTFLQGRAPYGSVPSTIVKAYFDRIFFHNPWRDQDQQLSSLVYEEDDGKIVGFQGVTPRRMIMKGQLVRVALSLHLMVEPGSRSTLAGVKLLKKLFSGPQDLSITDGANDLGRKLWEGVGGTTALLYSVNWTRLLRPSQYAMHLLGRKNRFLSSLSAASRPLGYTVDSLASWIMPHRFRYPSPPDLGGKLDEATFLECFSQFADFESLSPQYDLLCLKWLFAQASRARELGFFQKVAVRNERGKTIGWYLYYLNSGGISEVVHIAARNNSISEVLDHLFYHAWSNGSLAVSGRLEPRFMQELAERDCLLNCGRPWVLVHSNNPQLLRAIHRGDALMARIDGEWCLRPSAQPS